MRRLRPALASVLALGLVLATPLAALAGCSRCPRDCPMHAPAEGAVEAAPGSEHSAHGHEAHAVHDGDAAHADQRLHAHHGAHSDQHVHGDHGAHRAHGVRRDDQADAERRVASGRGTQAGAVHARHGVGAPDDCHRRARAARAAAAAGDVPCLTAACGHHDVVLSPVLPEALVSRVAAPGLVADGSQVEPDTLSIVPVDPPDLPTDPPRALLG